MAITTTPINSSPSAVNSIIRMGRLLSICTYPDNSPEGENILVAERQLILLHLEPILAFFRNAGARNPASFWTHRTPPDHATRDVQRSYESFLHRMQFALECRRLCRGHLQHRTDVFLLG